MASEAGGKADAVKKQLDDYRGDQLPRVMIMSDAKPRADGDPDERGEYLKPGDEGLVRDPGVPAAPPRGRPANRLGLARWLVMPEHPLTARVQVNRMWQHFFGAGIVKTSEDFGVQSEYPVHGELLDWLAVEFRERGWSMKAMHRLIVTSATYRQSSRVTPEHRARDLENRLYCAGEPVPDVVPDPAGLGTGVVRLARPPDRRAARLSLSARRDLGGARDHQGARLHLSRLLGQGPLPPQPLHLLATHRRPGQHVRRRRTGRPAACSPARRARRCTPSPRSTIRPGSRPRGRWPSGA